MGFHEKNCKELYIVQIRVKLNSSEYGKWHDYLSCLTVDEATSYMKEHLELPRDSTLPDMRVVHRVTYDEVAEVIARIV